MKILFVTSYINNAHFIEITKFCFDKNLDCDYDLICLNDAPDIDNGEEDYLRLISIVSKRTDCYKEIYDECIRNHFFHIKIPQNIHIKDRPNHSSFRHGEVYNYFTHNIDSLYPNYVDYAYLCFIDSDAFLLKPVNLINDLESYDLIAPLIYKNAHEYYPHSGLFFVNLKTVYNFKTMDFSLIWKDMGSGLLNFFANNKQYKIKEIGRYIGWHNDYHTTPRNEITDTVKIINGHIFDSWLCEKFWHLRLGSSFSNGSRLHRKNDNGIPIYIDSIKDLFKKFDTNIDFIIDHWISKN